MMAWVHVILFISCVAFSSVYAKRCDSSTVELEAGSDEKSIISPGYPQDYENNDECIWVIKKPAGGNSYIKLTAANVDLNDERRDCNSDFLDIFEGDSRAGDPAARWCGNDASLFKTHSDIVTLRFKSDDAHTSKGFTLFYSVVEFASTDCKEAAGDAIIVQKSSEVHETFQGSKAVPRCVWKIQASEPDERLSIHMFKPSAVSCEDGVYNFYEGNATSGHVSFQYCSSKEPFSAFYLQSSTVTITFEPKDGKKLLDDPDPMILSIKARDPMSACSVDKGAIIEVKDSPAIFSLPYGYDGSGKSCPVTVLTKEELGYLRLDVMGSDDHEATCDHDLINVYDSRLDDSITMECNEATFTPVYRQTKADGIKISENVDQKIYLRASAVPMACNGVVQKKDAYEDVVVKQVIPSEEGYPNLAHCTYLISAQNAGDQVSLTVSWDPTQKEKDLPNAFGDFIKVYDGYNEADKVLFSSRNRTEFPEGIKINKTIVSTKKDLLLVLDSDARITGNAAHISYFSIPGGNMCPEESQRVLVSRTPKMITSPNYPNALPLHQMCLHHLIAENPGETIVVEIVDANLQDHCENLLALFDGDYKKAKVTPKALGRVCGKDRPVFKLPNREITLMTKSVDSSGPGGWKAKVYTQARSGQSRTIVYSWLVAGGYFTVCVISMIMY